MNKSSRLKPLCAMTLLFFIWSSVMPHGAFSGHMSNWYVGGQQIPGSTTTTSPPSNTEPPSEPPHNPCEEGDPVYLHNGEFHYECSDLAIPARGVDIQLDHEYQSGSNFNGQFGFGWTINYHIRLKVLQNGDVLILKGNGRKDQYVSDPVEGFISPSGFSDVLVQNGDGTWTLTNQHGEKQEFDINGNLSAIVDRNENQLTFSYDLAGLLPRIGISLYSEIPGERVVTGYDYRLTTITDSAGREVLLSYNSDGLLDHINDFAGRTVIYEYDPQTNDLLKITYPSTAQYPAGITKEFSYDNHKLRTITDGKGQTFVTNHYNAESKVEKQDLGEGSLVFTYGTNETTVTDRMGFVTTYTFNTKGNPLSIEEFTQGLRIDDPASFLTTYTYNEDSLVTSVTYPKGNGQKNTYDDANLNPQARGNLLQVRKKADVSVADNDTNDIVVNMTYEPNFNLIKTITDPKGNVTTLTYDYELPPGNSSYGNKGNLTTVEYPLVNGASPTTTYDYDEYGQVTEISDPNGNTIQYDYSPTTGTIIEIRRDPDGINAVTTMVPDVYGYLDRVTDENNHSTEYTYNALGWLVDVTNPLNFKTKYTHDQNGNVTKIERQQDQGGTQWQATEFTYTILNKVKTVKNPLLRETVFGFDLNENLTSIQDPEGRVTVYAFDERDYLYTVTDARTPVGITQYDYDSNGTIRQITDAYTNPTSYEHDGFDRQTKIIYPDSRFSEFAYDKNLNITRHRTPSTKLIEYDYDELNRLIGKRYPQTPSLDNTYDYDLNSRLTDANNATAQIHYNYDALDRILDVTQNIDGNNWTVGYEYLKNDAPEYLTYPSTKRVGYTYDNHDRLDQISVDSARIAEYEYDPLDRRIRKTYFSSTEQTTDYSYDIGNHLTAVANAVAPTVGPSPSPCTPGEIEPGAPISQYGYPTYDQVGNRKEIVSTYLDNAAKTVNYQYNDVYELTNVTGASSTIYDYDIVGNRETADGTAYITNALNQYESVGSETYAYDGNGNLVDDGSNVYTYSEDNMLLTIQNSQAYAEYAYDALGRRVSKTVNGDKTYFVYDGNQVIAEYDSSGILSAEYIYGEGIDEVLAMDRSGQKYYYHYDGLGSVTEITNTAATVIEHYEYGPFGTTTIKDAPGNTLSESAIQNPYGFTGRRLDNESGIYYYRARMYSPSIGRFLQRDPLGYHDSMNLYEYCNNNPINRVDPSGAVISTVSLILLVATLSISYGLPIFGSINEFKNKELRAKQQIEEMSSSSYYDYLSDFPGFQDKEALDIWLKKQKQNEKASIRSACNVKQDRAKAVRNPSGEMFMNLHFDENSPDEETLFYPIYRAHDLRQIGTINSNGGFTMRTK